MTETIIVALISGLVTLIGTVITTITTGSTNRKKMVEKIDAVESKLNAHIKDDDERAAKAARIRILRFYDELCAGEKHSENHFEDILDDINFYEQYCTAHPDFPNNRGKIAMDCIKKVYAEKKQQHIYSDIKEIA